MICRTILNFFLLSSVELCYNVADASNDSVKTKLCQCTFPNGTEVHLLGSGIVAVEQLLNGTMKIIFDSCLESGSNTSLTNECGSGSYLCLIIDGEPISINLGSTSDIDFATDENTFNLTSKSNSYWNTTIELQCSNSLNSSIEIGFLDEFSSLKLILKSPKNWLTVAETTVVNEGVSSGASIISIIIGVILVAYFVVRACVLKCCYHAEGLEVIPHYKILCTIASRLKSTCLFCYHGFKRSSGYDEIH